MFRRSKSKKTFNIYIFVHLKLSTRYQGEQLMKILFHIKFAGHDIPPSNFMGILSKYHPLILYLTPPPILPKFEISATPPLPP